MTYTIPEGMHQTLQEQFFFVDVEPVEGIAFEETIYPEGKKDAEGYTEYHGKVTLIKEFKLADDLKDPVKLKVYAGSEHKHEAQKPEILNI